MYLQRMIIDHRGDLNYDYMGSAEFEFGSTGRARTALARLVINKELTGRKVRLFEKWGRSCYGPVEVSVFGSKEAIDKLVTKAPTDTVLDDLVIKTDQESARIDDDQYVGWMRVDPYSQSFDPLFILRVSDENIKLGNRFLQKFIDQILAEEAEV